jgi:hypothetical protein
MPPLIQAPSVIPQLILSLCTVSIATCNKLFENMTPFYGDSNKTKILGTVNRKTFYWKIDTGSVVTCMNINTFKTAFGKIKEGQKIQNRPFYKKRKCSHTVQVSDEFSKNTLGSDFLQKFRLHLNRKTQQIEFLPTPSKALFATRNFTLPPFATTLVQARTFQTINKDMDYIADIGVPKQPLISGTSTWASFDERNHCTIQLQNCAPHEVSLETGDILGIVDTLILLDDDSLTTICEQIHQRLPKIKKRTWTRKEIEDRCHLGATEPYRSQYIDTVQASSGHKYGQIRFGPSKGLHSPDPS